MTSIEERILARSLFPLLKENEGVIVHCDGKGYVVAKQMGDDKELKINILEDDDVLQHKDLSLVWLHDEEVGNA